MLWTIPAEGDGVVYDPLEATFDDWLVDHVSRLGTQLDLDLEPESASDRLKALFAQAVDLAIASGGSLAGVQPEGNLEQDGGSTGSETETGSESLMSCPPMCPPPNQPPDANDDGPYKAAWNTQFALPDTWSNNILANDVDMDGPEWKKAYKVTDPSNGTVDVFESGAINYVPNIGFTGMDSFTYKIFDGLAYSDPATVTIHVIGINLEIHDGQDGAVLPEEPHPESETLRGAYTVANRNDTDGDGFLFVDSGDGHVKDFSTTFDGPLDPGTETFTVDDPTGFKQLQMVRIRPTATAVFEDSLIWDLVGNQVTLISGLKFPYPLGGTMFHPGRPEVDLMKLVIHRPTATDPAAPDLHLSWSGVTLWLTPEKQFPWADMPGQTVKVFPLTSVPEQGGLTLYAEAAQSTSLRDLHISLEYPIPLHMGAVGVTDEVRATGIWSDVIAVSARHDPASLFTDPDALFPDCEDPPRPLATAAGGTGVIPITGTEPQIGNGIMFQFDVLPHRAPADGTWESDKVFFDATRRKEGHVWQRDLATGDWSDVFPARFPLRLEDPNDDDLQEVDESDEVTALHHFYSYDLPRWDRVPNPSWEVWAYRRNFIEWLRVGFGESPEGDVVAGSRVSDRYFWHAAHTLENVLQGNTRVVQRVEGYLNTIGDGHLSKPEMDHP